MKLIQLTALIIIYWYCPVSKNLHPTRTEEIGISWWEGVGFWRSKNFKKCLKLLTGISKGVGSLPWGLWTFPETTQFYFQTYFSNQGVWPNIAMIDWPHSPGYQLHQKGIPPLVPSSLQPFHDLQGPGWRIRMSVSDASWPSNKLSS